MNVVQRSLPKMSYPVSCTATLFVPWVPPCQFLKSHCPCLSVVISEPRRQVKLDWITKKPFDVFVSIGAGNLVVDSSEFVSDYVTFIFGDFSIFAQISFRSDHHDTILAACFCGSHESSKSLDFFECGVTGDGEKQEKQVREGSALC